MQANTILVVEDEQEIRDLLQFSLERSGFKVDSVVDAEQALDKLHEKLPNLILIDWMLPGIDGVELARRIRNDDATMRIPLIMLTARGEERDKLKSFESGIDDYVTKPFSPRELTARIKAVLRRSGIDAEEKIRIDRLELDPVGYHVHVDGETVHLRPTEYRVLEMFMKHPNRAYSRAQLLNSVWGKRTYVDDRTVDVHIRRLRKALEPFDMDDLVKTVWGVGYRLNPDYLGK